MILIHLASMLNKGIVVATFTHFLLDIMPQITDQELQKLMKLTNIHLDGDDKDKLLENMDNIIGFLEQLNTVDTTDVVPLTHPIAGHTISLADVVPVDCDDPEAYLANIKHRMINNAVKIKSMLA